MSKIVLEDFSEGDGYYKVDLAYLSKEQVEEIEALVSKWKPTNEDIKACIGMCLTDVNEQRFKDYGTNLRDCLAWLEKQVKETTISQHENKTCKRNNDSLTSKIINALCTITKYAERELGLDAIDGVDIEDICYWLKKQGQSFPILSNSSKTVKDWTEEDERGSDETIELLEYFINYTPEFRRPAIRRSIDWLQSLKQRMEE